MKEVVLFIVVVLLSPLTLLAQNRQDSLAIKSASMDYVEGWYEADYKRMESSLHPDSARQDDVAQDRKKQSRTSRPRLHIEPR